MRPRRAGTGKKEGFRRKIRCIGCDSVGRSEMEVGDKVVLYPEVLRELEDAFASGGPLTFEIRNEKKKRLYHCGVLDFSAKEYNTAIVPRWIMKKMGIKDQGTLVFRHKRLPPVSFISLKPLSHKFIESVSKAGNDPRRELEYSLLNFTTLTAGEKVRVRHDGKDYSIMVMELKPAKACCVVSGECELDLQPPDKMPDADSTRVLKIGEELQGVVDDDGIVHYAIRCPARQPAIQVTLSKVGADAPRAAPTLAGGSAAETKARDEGDADLYISATDSKPTRSLCTWSNASVANEKSITIQSTDPSWPKRVGETKDDDDAAVWFYVAVAGYKGTATFVLSVAEGVPEELGAAETTGRLGSGPATGGIPGVGYVICSTCGQRVPERSEAVHAAFCARNNVRCDVCGDVLRKAEADQHWHCPVCKEVVPLEEKEKHHELRHKPVKCECGVEVPADRLLHHQRTECVKRRIACKFCQVTFASTAIEEHESYCGGRTIECKHCGKPIPLRKQDIHMAVEHNINLSISAVKESSALSGSAFDATEVTAKILASRAEKKERDDLESGGGGGGGRGATDDDEEFTCPKCLTAFRGFSKYTGHTAKCSAPERSDSPIEYSGSEACDDEYVYEEDDYDESPGVSAASSPRSVAEDIKPEDTSAARFPSLPVYVAPGNGSDDDPVVLVSDEVDIGAATIAEAERRTMSGDALPAARRRRGLPCPSCEYIGDDEEQLQIHMLTTCASAPK